MKGKDASSLPSQSFSEEETYRQFCFKRDERRTSPDPESGRGILICEIFTLNHAHNLQLEKQSIVPFCALKRETRLDQFQLAGP
ncbi:MAG TPA: hypothetical protein VNA15_02545 [Candidatus Angelobacter sp.]|nr:hypothetical protein [Candidatus Angelobacter sp.]